MGQRQVLPRAHLRRTSDAFNLRAGPTLRTDEGTDAEQPVVALLPADTMLPTFRTCRGNNTLL